MIKLVSNNYQKYVKGELKLQSDTYKYLLSQFPHGFYFHTPNEGKRSDFERFVFSIMGAKKGMVDMFFLTPDISLGCINPFAIELKFGKNIPTQAQMKTISELNKININTYVCWTLDSVIDVISLHWGKTVFGNIEIKEHEGMKYLTADTIPKKFFELIPEDNINLKFK